MGMFDTITFNCPFCGKEIEEQTKAGPCMLKDYKFDVNKKVNVHTASLVSGMYKCYDGCQKLFTIKPVGMVDLEVVEMNEDWDDV